MNYNGKRVSAWIASMRATDANQGAQGAGGRGPEVGDLDAVHWTWPMASLVFCGVLVFSWYLSGIVFVCFWRSGFFLVFDWSVVFFESILER